MRYIYFYKFPTPALSAAIHPTLRILGFTVTPKLHFLRLHGFFFLPTIDALANFTVLLCSLLSQFFQRNILLRLLGIFAGLRRRQTIQKLCWGQEIHSLVPVTLKLHCLSCLASSARAYLQRRELTGWHSVNKCTLKRRRGGRRRRRKTTHFTIIIP